MVMKFQDIETAELKKHSSIIASSNKNISVPQRKLYNAILYLTGKQLQNNQTQQKFKLKFAEITRFSGYDDFSNRNYLKKAIKELTDTSVEYNLLGKDNENEWGVFSLISHATIKEFDEYITVEFPSIITENIIYPNIYSLLNLSITNRLDGKYSLPLYELLTDYKKVKKLSIPIGKFRDLVGVDENLYPLIGNLKAKVIEPTIAEINAKTDLEVDYLLEKISSRSFTHIEFIIKDRNMVLNPVENSAYMLLKSKGMPEATAMKFAKKLSKKNVVDAVEALEKAIKRGSIKNITAYLTKILKNVEIDDDETVELVPPSGQSAPSDYKPIVEDPKNNLDYRKYISNRISDIIADLSMTIFNNFVSEQNSFTIEHFISNNIIDENKKIVNLVALSENIVFRGWIEKKYLDETIEYKMFLEKK